MNPADFAEKHPSDRRRGVSTLVLPGHRLVCVDQNATELAAVMGRLVLAEHDAARAVGGKGGEAIHPAGTPPTPGKP